MAHNTEDKKLPFESTQKDIRDAIEAVADSLGYITGRTASDVAYDNTTSGLTADDVQEAIDELSAEKIDKSGVDIKTNTSGQFDTVTGGIMQSFIVGFEPIQSGEGTPSPSNIRPITGHTSGEVFRCGKNRLNIKNERDKGANAIVVFTDTGLNLSNTVSSTWNAYSAYLTNLLPNTSYKVICDVTVRSGASTITIGSGSTTILTISNPSGHIERTFTTPSETDAMFIGLFSSNATSSTGNVEYANLMVCLESVTDASYEPYQAQDITVQFGSTYYGGYVDFVSGVLTATMAYATITSFSGKSGSTVNNAFYKNISNIKRINSGTVANIVSNMYVADKYSTITGTNDTTHIGVNEYGNVVVGFGLSSSIDTLQEADAWASEHPIEIAYELATPLTIQLSPSQINTLVGQNNLSAPLEGQTVQSAQYREVMAWSDIDIESKADITAMGTDETGRTTASQAYSADDIFYKDGKMCVALTAISQGEAFTKNTNYVETNVANLLATGGGGDIYSTSERVIGTWIDGSILYEKTIDFGALPANTTKNVNHSILNLDIVTQIIATATRPASQGTYASIPVPSTHWETVGNQNEITITDTYITIRNHNANASAFTKVYVTLKYTKTSTS